MSWVFYSLLVAGLAALAAVPMERALALLGRPTRMVWAGVFLVAAGIPAAAAVTMALGATVADLAGGVPGAGPVVVALSPLAVGIGEAAPGLQELLGAAFPAAWAATSGVLLLLLLGSRISLLRDARTWKSRTLEGQPVWVSEDVGPAVLGLLRFRIVLPSWVLEGSGETRRLILSHEREHMRARDPLLVFAAAVACVLAPWNVPLWWALRRLRLAVEMDCDQRVLHSSTVGVRRRYGHLLLEVGRRARRPLPAMASFSEGRSSLSRRVMNVVASRPRHPRRRALALAGLGSALLVAACLVPGPDGSAGVEDQEDPPPAIAIPTFSTRAGPAAANGGGQPVFTPYTRAPELLNRSDIQRALAEEYPPRLLAAGIGGTTYVHLFIDGSGDVRSMLLDVSSGHQALDDAALRVAARMRFSPGLNRDQPVAVWISLPIVFQVASQGSPKGSPQASPSTRRPPPPAPSGTSETDVGAAPTFTPYTRAPAVLNRSEIQRALEEEYPPLLRDAGIGGTVYVHFFIHDDGTLGDVRIDASSGHQVLDEAALTVARKMTFSPALNGDEAVPVWISLPIIFQVR